MEFAEEGDLQVQKKKCRKKLMDTSKNKPNSQNKRSGRWRKTCFAEVSSSMKTKFCTETSRLPIFSSVVVSPNLAI
jgi:hypothetical protein